MADQTHVRILFWNVGGIQDCGLISSLAASKCIDILALAEFGAESDVLLPQLRRLTGKQFFEPNSLTARIKIYAKDDRLDLRELHSGGRLTIRTLQFDGTAFLLAAAHLVSKVNWTLGDQAAESAIVAGEIQDIEREQGHERTILFGDLNMNPFDAGVVQASGLHAMMTKEIVASGSRKIQGRTYPFFYNPMWGFFGDRTTGPAGTHYFRHSGHISYDWNIFDQVLIRHDAIPWLHEDIEIITEVDGEKLFDDNRRPDPRIGSDHFPLLFQLTSRRK